jgi:hypothetical protein
MRSSIGVKRSRRNALRPDSAEFDWLRDFSLTQSLSAASLTGHSSITVDASVSMDGSRTITNLSNRDLSNQTRGPSECEIHLIVQSVLQDSILIIEMNYNEEMKPWQPYITD